MPSIQVTSQTALSYTDSGVPTNSDGKYKTIVVIHGFTWSGETFRPSIQEAPSRGVRIISINRRGFPGSTPYSDEELRSLSNLTSNGESSREEMLRFMADRSSEFASFIHQIVLNEKIPVPDGHGNGGIALMGWSFGNTFAMHFVYHARQLQEPYRATVMKYVTSCIFFDAPSDVINIPPLPGVFEGGALPRLAQVVLKTTGTTPADPKFPILLAHEFNELASGWFQFDLPTSDDLHAIAAALEKGDDNPIKPSTWKTEEDAGNTAFAACYIPYAGPSDQAISGAGQSTGAYAVTSDAVCKGEEWRSPELEGFRLSWMYCENSCWAIIYAALGYKEVFPKGRDGKEGLRKMICVPGANHFVQWNDPERFLRFATSII